MERLRHVTHVHIAENCKVPHTKAQFVQCLEHESELFQKR